MLSVYFWTPYETLLLLVLHRPHAGLFTVNELHKLLKIHVQMEAFSCTASNDNDTYGINGALQ